MKLRVKLTIISISLIVAAVSACCFIILSFTQQKVLNDVIFEGLTDYKNFYYSFEVAAAAESHDSKIVQRSFLINRFQSITGAKEFTLRSKDDILCNNTGIDAKSIIADGSQFDINSNNAEKGRYKAISVSGQDYLIVYCTMLIHKDTYSISLVRDISDATQSVKILAVQCIVASILVIVLAAAVIWAIIFRAFKPVGKLQKGASELAQGHYENRIPITGKDELSALAADFNSMAGAIEAHIETLHETAERQQAFINGLSHELKTPVTSIMLNSETLLNRKVSEKDMNRSLERIYDQSKWLEKLSGKLMTLVMLQGEINIKPESMPYLFDVVRDTVLEAMKEKNLEFVTDCRIKELPMDFDLMRSALVNLVDNARKASGSGQTVEMRAYGNVIEVADHGRGIPKEEIARITEPFYMVDRSRSKKSGGAGLGLAIVKRIVEAHGAQLIIESIPGKGTTIRLIFKERQW